MKNLLLALALSMSLTQIVNGLDIQKLVDESVDQGLIVATIDGHEVKYYSAGKFDRNDDQEITPDTFFEIGGLTKTFTSLLLLDAVHRGVVTLDTPISVATDGHPVPNYNGKEITFKDLALHTSGLPLLPTNLDPADPQDPYADYAPWLLWNFLESYELKHAPGCEFEYSDIGTGLLGFLLGRIDSGHSTSFSAALRRRILAPMELQDTAVALDANQQARLAPGHNSVAAVPNWNYSAIMQGSGALYSTARDMARFMQIQLNQIQTPFKGQICESHVPRFYLCLNYRVGMGWFVELLPRVLSHQAQTGGYQAYMALNPWCNKAVVVLSNSNSCAIEVGERIVFSWFLWASEKHQAVPLEIK